MKIGIVTTWFERGAAVVSRQFMDVLTKQGHEIFIYARGGEEFAKKDANWNLPNVTWNSFLYSNIPTDINKKQFTLWIENNELDAVLFNEQQYLEPILWAKKLNVKTIAYVDYYTKYNFKAYRVYDQLWCNTKRHFSAFNWHKNAKYIPWGTDVELYSPKSKESKRDYYFFHSAGMSPFRKGTDVFVNALFHESEKLLAMDRKSLIHTQVSLTKSFPELKEKLDYLISNGLLDVVEKTVPAPGLYHKGTVYVYPSRLEGIGLTLAEAAMAGMYIITTDEEPMREFAMEGCAALIPVVEKYEREDGYYWDMVTPSVIELSKILLESPDINSNLICEKAKKDFDFKKNACVLSEHLNDLQVEAISIKDIESISNNDSKVGIMFKRKTVFNRYLFTVLKKLKMILS
ncbi:glycosyltransferase [Pseudoalteromonas undina]|uniref:Glycosyltransferase n=1 Tax=Pseudoalteromonas undina TaxID=43660 RepID=A0ACC6R990_9GAMM